MRGRKRLDANDFEVLEVDTGYVTPCHIPLSSVGRPFHVDADGYSIMLRTGADGKRVRSRAHRVRYEAVHGPLEGGLVPDHLCRHRACCNPAHMEAVTVAENNRRGDATKLSPEKVIEIRAMYAAGGRNQADLAHEFGVSQSHISRIVTGEYWSEGLSPAWNRVKARRAKARVGR